MTSWFGPPRRCRRTWPRGTVGRDRMQHWRIAYGSAREVDCHLRLLAQAGAVDGRRAETALRLFDEVRAITWRLLHPARG